jgi:Lecithin retinol acyltransferase
MQSICQKAENLQPRNNYRCGLRPSDQPLDREREPPVGAHLVTPRRGYTHHGIYIGGGQVVHYAGLARGLRPGPIEEVTLSQFARGSAVWARAEEARCLDREEVVRRARLRLGENRYRVLTNNCEHFCEWCIRGEPRSYQVDKLITRYCQTWYRFVEPIIRALNPSTGLHPREDRRMGREDQAADPTALQGG